MIMMTDTQSILQRLNLPSEFGVVLLAFCFILAVAPYFAGSDFGVFKIPAFEIRMRRRLRVLGPAILVIAILLHLPLFRTSLAKPIPGRVSRISSPAKALWQPVPIRVVNNRGETFSLEYTWHDIAWVGSEGWLCGSREEGGGSDQFLGHGILLHTVNDGASWQDITNTVESDQGTLAKFPNQSWNGVGPITSIEVYPRKSENGTTFVEGWLASWTGIYMTADAANGTWHRVTPKPSKPPAFAHFQRIAAVEAFREIYAVGWQGIAHWERGGKWQVQLPTYKYLIVGVSVFGDTQRDVWAVGRTARDEYGKEYSDSHGTIYHLRWPQNQWQQVPTGIPLEIAQTFLDIRQINYETVIAVGERGLILRGTAKNNVWVWRRAISNTPASLNAIALEGNTVWVVGDHGVILNSHDDGATWSVIQNASAVGNFRRIRFFTRSAWIVGDGVVLNQHKS
ncbi:MAG TPA: YCF48-related protein [Thermoanaerobaculia bacterium]|nr:YCF48-related protein [Thermoanaerobaculia bacterium]